MYHKTTAFLSTSLSSTLGVVCLCCQVVDLPYNPAPLTSDFCHSHWSNVIYTFRLLGQRTGGTVQSLKSRRQISTPGKLLFPFYQAYFLFLRANAALVIFRQLNTGDRQFRFWKVVFEGRKGEWGRLFLHFKLNHCNRIKDFPFTSLFPASSTCHSDTSQW